MRLRTIKKALAPLRRTPLHPQWQPASTPQPDIFSDLTGRVLDIGCGESAIRAQMPESGEYIGLDYYHTATEWYQTQPDIYGDGQRLPFADHSFEHVLLLHVLEHIASPMSCLGEARRVLKPGGSLLIQTPFIYPIHDAPLDYHRWTEFGLNQLAEASGFEVVSYRSFGRPTDTAALMTNLALSKLLADWIQSKSPLIFLGVFFPPLILINNMVAWLFSIVAPEDGFMPSSYQMVWKKR